MVTVYGIAPGSIAEKKGVMVGDKLHTVNGNEICDVLDYRFYLTDSRVTLAFDRDGVFYEIEILKEMYADIGLEFETYLMDNKRSCQNRCIFCFIDQNPCGMRKTLYFKDDDSRLSFLFGNYITLTNLSQHEIDRIISMHISPVNVSVHTTNPELRCKMMNNRFAGESLDIMRKFAAAGIVLNCQLVICPGINDGDELRRSLSDLEEMGVNSVAIVPVGLTDHREGLYPLTPFCKETAGEVIDIVESFAQKCLEKHSRRIAFAADELYIKAEREIPAPEYYEDYPCLENGVGLIALQKEEFTFALEDAEGDENLKRHKTIACGVSAAPYLEELCSMLSEKFPEIRVNVRPIVNNFFGKMINVSGLIVGKDLIEQLADKDLGDEIIIPSCMLRSGEDVFLDDITLTQAQKALNTKFAVVENSGDALLNAILN